MNVNDIKEKNLVYFGERIEPYFASSIIIRGMLDRRNLAEILEWNKGVRWLYTNGYFFNIKTDLSQAQATLKDKFKGKPRQYAGALVGKCFEYGNSLIGLSKKIRRDAERKDLDKKKMRGLLEKYAAAGSNYMIFQNIALFEGPIAELTDELTGKYSENEEGRAALAGLITTASSPTAGEKETDDFLRLCISGDRGKLLDNHVKKYGWLPIRFFIGEPWTKNDVINRLDETSAAKARAELAKREQYRKGAEDKIRKATRNFSDEDKDLVQLIRDVVYLRTQRTDFFQESSYYVQPLVKRIAAVLGVSYSDLLHLSAREVLSSLQGKFDFPGAIKRRKKGFLVFFDFDKDAVLEAGEALDYVRERPVLDRAAKYVKEFSGNTAYKGHAVGKVKIVKTARDNAKFAKGDILVSIITTPNLAPAMQKAAAIITDEGGITCHAAIFAREMKKPCVTGTRIATKVLKDGDLVEVDADKGVVKIL